MLFRSDWVEPMMPFLLARHMFMHSSCIRTLFSFLSLVRYCDYVFLSLSLSLSLSDRLQMAPKCKSIPSWNPLHSRTSSSDSTPLHILFHDEKAHKEFLENFSNCGIHLECHVFLSDFSDTALPIVIHSQGCESLCKILVRCPTVFI